MGVIWLTGAGCQRLKIGRNIWIILCLAMTAIDKYWLWYVCKEMKPEQKPTKSTMDESSAKQFNFVRTKRFTIYIHTFPLLQGCLKEISISDNTAVIVFTYDNSIQEEFCIVLCNKQYLSIYHGMLMHFARSFSRSTTKP